jgi:hypothetical protein
MALDTLEILVRKVSLRALIKTSVIMKIIIVYAGITLILVISSTVFTIRKTSLAGKV